jgi:chemosensory pili system protein ChpA (sensor histidine kinase/response regulator)
MRRPAGACPPHRAMRFPPGAFPAEARYDIEYPAMSNANQAAFDPSQLMWVRGEIEHSLTKARENLDLVAANPRDAKAIQSIVADLHQVTGALVMVGLGAAARLNEECEKLAATFKDGVPSESAKHVMLLKHATVNLSNYLDSLVAGHPDRPMELAASYVMLNKARGANDASASDLFTPDLSAAAPEPGAGEQAEGDVSAGAINLSRGMFQAGLLKLMRNKDLAGGARDMRDAVLAIEALNVSPSSRAFWFAAGGFFDAVANDPSGTGALAAPLFGSIDQQIKGLVEGKHDVPEKLFRNMLLVIGRSAARTERIAQIRQMYRLDELLAVPDAKSRAKPDKALVPVIHALHEQVRELKDDFQQFASGADFALPALAKNAAMLAAGGQQLAHREMAKLLQLLGAVGRHLGKTGKAPTEIQALEIATAMLFAESSLEDYFKLTPEFDQQAAMICSRIQNVMTGVELPDPRQSGSSLSDTMMLQAQTQLLISQVGKEVQSNLAQIEGALDAYFRDAEKVDGLQALEQLFKQVRGALMMLEHEDAAALSKVLAEHAAQFASGAVKGEGEEAHAIAEGVSALGLFVEALQQGSPDARAMLLPALVRFNIPQKPPEPKKVPPKAPAAKEIAAPEKSKAPERAEPGTTHTRRQLREAVGEAKRTAEPGTTHTRKQLREAVGEAKKVVDPGMTFTRKQLREAVSEAKKVVDPGVTFTRKQLRDAVSEAKRTTALPAAGAIPPPVAPRPVSGAPGELELLRRSEAELTAVVHEREQRIRTLQMQMVQLHKEAKAAADLRAEVKELRAALAKLERKR